jgi:hypothetical protein
MVKRGEITGISAGYRVEEWQISDENGDIIDPEKSRLRRDDADDLTYTAVVWELIECSLVTTPADTAATVRSIGGGYDHALPAFADIRVHIANDGCRAREPIMLAGSRTGRER